MNCLITGGAGFIGSNLADQLVKLNHKVIVLDNLSTGRVSNLKKIKEKIEFVNVDISDKKNSLQKYFNDIDWVFHLAGKADLLPSIANPSQYFYTNVEGTLNVLEVSRKANIKKFIYAASASCYGIPTKFPTKENALLDPKNPYALTKLLGEQLTLHWSNLYGMPNLSLRFFNVYGPRSTKTGAYGSVFNIFLAQKLASKPLTIVGDGNQTRDFIHVNDVIDAMLQAAKQKKTAEIYNVGSGQETSINSIANIIGGEKVTVTKRPGETDRSLADISKIKAELNWKPTITLDKGIQMLLENIKDWEKALVATPDTIKEETKNWYKFLERN